MDKTKDSASLWTGSFGDEYTVRNSQVPNRRAFWETITLKYLTDQKPVDPEHLDVQKPKKVIEVGCNIGANLKYLAELAPWAYLLGTDVNALALEAVNDRKITTMQANLFKMPWYFMHVFDLVVCIGVLVHTLDEELDDAIRAVFRLSRKHVLIGEYWAQEWTPIPYHGYENALRKGPFDHRIAAVAHKLPIETGFLDKGDGFDRVTWWMYKV